MAVIAVPIEIVTFDKELVPALFGTRTLEPGKTTTEIVGGARLDLTRWSFTKVVGSPDTIHLLLSFERDTTVGVISTWLYDRFRGGHVTTLRIDDREVGVQKREIERALTEAVAQRSKAQ